MVKQNKMLYGYLAAILGGSAVGFLLPSAVPYLAPLSQIFINLLLTAMIPYVYFSIASAIASIKSNTGPGQVTAKLAGIFIGTGLIAAFIMLIIVIYSPITAPIHTMNSLPAMKAIHPGQQIVAMVSVAHFYELFSPNHLLPLIVFAILTGISLRCSELSHAIGFFNTATVLSLELVKVVMLLAPIGFFAYFSVLTHDFGQQLLKGYAKIFLMYYLGALAYFFAAYSLYVYFARGQKGVKPFWQIIQIPAFTAFATCSSAASIPLNIAAMQQLKVPRFIANIVVPLGTFLHKEGSIMGGILKIAFLFSLYHLPFYGIDVYAIAILVSLLVGSVMGAIPSGGMLGEMLILACYGFPQEALLAIAVISMIIDPLATMLNAIGNSVSCLLLQKWLGLKNEA